MVHNDGILPNQRVVMELNYFGTDGIRGRAFAPPLTLEETGRWGQAWAQVAAARGIEELVIGWDPRLSSEPLAQAFVAGLDGRLRLCVLGMVPTPAVAHAASTRPLAWGLMLSASHNPPEDNGIKGFDGNGEKIPEADEAALEAVFETLPARADAPRPMPIQTAVADAYIQHLGGIDLPDGLELVMDCAHGATAPWAPRLFRGKGIHWLGVPADGARINVGVGSTHTEQLAAKVKERGAAAGIAFDGDGDRCLMVDGAGTLVDGDQLLWLLAQDRHRCDQPLPGVVGTVMSNGGLEEALGSLGIPFVRTPVGDKHMLRELGRRGWDLAAEASGHIVQKHVGPSGDGMATALAALAALLRRSPADRWSWRFQPWPLRLVNILASDRRPVEECPRLLAATRSLEASHGAALRMVIRWSGTEPKLRLMVEAKETTLMNQALETLELAARADLAAQ
jgi:phosphoglucosamine mutase